MKPGDTYCQWGKVKRFHILTYVMDYKGRMLFFDTVTYDIYLITYKTVEKALDTKIYHPVRQDLRMFDFIETLPEEVLEVIKAEVELKIKEKEPEILDLF